MSILNKVKDYIMGRPKNSKNKPKVTPEPVEFNYEDETAAAAYNVAVNSPAAAPQPVYEYALEEQAATTAVHTMVDMSASTLFLINGHVRLTRRGEDPITAEQTRLVYARDFNEAVAKYNNYFASLSNPNEIYVVIGAGGSEAIR